MLNVLHLIFQVIYISFKNFFRPFNRTKIDVKMYLEEHFNASAGKFATADLISKIFTFCELYSGVTFYPYQEQFSKRLIRSILENDGAEITALFARQSGKSETVATTVGGLMIILPKLANMPMFLGDPRLDTFKDGLWVGIFAPSQRQAQITYNRMRSRMQSKSANVILTDPDFRLSFSTSNGQTVALTNGSFATAISASDGSNIEGESFKLIICEECQDIGNFKIRKCLTGDTRILMSNGEYKLLQDLVADKKGEVVLYNQDMKYLTSSNPLEFYDNGVQDVYKLRLNNGDTIEATLNHQFYTFSKNIKKSGVKFRTVQDIINSFDKYSSLRIGVPDTLPYFAEEQPLDYESGLIIGYLLGDGCLKGTPKFIGDVPTNNRLYSLIKMVVNSEINMVEYAYTFENGMQEVNFSTKTNKKGSNPLITWLKDFGIYNLTGENKCLPDKLYSESFYKGYIEGLIETDGCVESSMSKPIISFANISYRMISQLKDIYLKFGIHSTLFIKDNSKGISTNSKPLNLLHVKSVLDIQRFADSITLFRKQVYLNNAINTLATKKTRNKSECYPESMRFYKVTLCEYVGKKPTYCLKTEGRNFIANNMISSNSIHPMGASYNATIVKIGTSTTFKGDFYEAIERNKRDYDRGELRIKNHFEYDCDVVMKYNLKYAKYVAKEKYRLGENSDEFQMAYKLKWILQRGMFVDITLLEKNNGLPNCSRVFHDKENVHVVGIDVAGKGDATLVTVVEVDWNNPVISEEKINDDGTIEMYQAFKTLIKDWKELMGEDYEEQYYEILDYLSNFNVKRVMIDATKEASLAHRMRANLPYEVIPFIFSSKSKSDMYKHLDVEIKSARATFPMSDDTQKSREYSHFIQQLGDLQKGYSGQYLVVSHPPERGAKDDYADSWALAVYGTKESGEVTKPEVSPSNPFLQRNHNQAKKFYSGRNNLTARRR